VQIQLYLYFFIFFLFLKKLYMRDIHFVIPGVLKTVYILYCSECIIIFLWCNPFVFSKDEVFTEALKALYGTNYGSQTSEKSGALEKVGHGEKQQQQREPKFSVIGDGNRELMLPRFCDMARYLAERVAVRMQSAATRHTVGNHVLPFSPATFVEVSCFCLLGGKVKSALNVNIWKVMIKHY
jgi:hypothetical protein